ncbi:MAG: hypothetical protein IKA18_03020 [Clostridia bacterium]|nr:hypothetical protein [Clostridia bacterium]MBR2875270.1 hypothetical protein [Clostridia bacterium]MBR6692359.1 hypothetical protein [Clostridia bacterium]
MAKGKGKDYFGLGRLVSLILVIIPITSLVCGVITRFAEGKIVAAILRLVLGWNVIWILDIVFMILNGRIFRLLNI